MTSESAPSPVPLSPTDPDDMARVDLWLSVRRLAEAFPFPVSVGPKASRTELIAEHARLTRLHYAMSGPLSRLCGQAR